MCLARDNNKDTAGGVVQESNSGNIHIDGAYIYGDKRYHHSAVVRNKARNEAHAGQALVPR